MKKIFFSSLVTILVFVFSLNVVFAQGTSSGEEIRGGKQEVKSGIRELVPSGIEEKREEVRRRFRELREERKEEFKEKREELKKRFEEKRKELKDKRFEKVVERFGKILSNRRAHLDRLDVLAGKIQSRIDKLKERGVDVSAMQAAQDGCQETKNLASASIDDAEKSVSNIDFNAPNAREIAKAQVAAIRNGNQAVKSYHKCLVGVIKSAPKAAREGETDGQ